MRKRLESLNAHVPRRRFLQSALAAGVLHAGPSLNFGAGYPSRKPYKIIDIHAHDYPIEYLELLDSFGGSETGTAISRNCFASKEPADLEFRFRVMGEAGIDMQVLSVPPQFPYSANEQHGVGGARRRT